MFRSVLLPVDMTDQASWQKALPMALGLAGNSGRLHILGIVHDLGSAMVADYLPEGFERQALERMKTELDAFAERELPGGAKAEVHVGHGHVAQTILDTAGRLGADLIVMAAHPPGDLRTLMVGSNADRVVHHATIPVLVVR